MFIGLSMQDVVEIHPHLAPRFQVYVWQPQVCRPSPYYPRPTSTHAPTTPSYFFNGIFFFIYLILLFSLLTSLPPHLHLLLF